MDQEKRAFYRELLRLFVWGLALPPVICLTACLIVILFRLHQMGSPEAFLVASGVLAGILMAVCGCRVVASKAKAVGLGGFLGYALCFFFLLVFWVLFFPPRVLTSLFHRGDVSVLHRVPNEGRQMRTALTLYAADHEGRLPTGAKFSNEALRQLIPTYLDEEKSFYLSQSPFCSKGFPDEEWGQENPDRFAEEALAPGENAWAYVSGLTDSDDPTLPILVLGFTANGNEYDETHLGWEMKKTVVVYLDGSAEIRDLHPVGDGTTYEVRGRGKWSDRNMFAPEALGGGRLLNPGKPERR